MQVKGHISWNVTISDIIFIPEDYFILDNKLVILILGKEGSVTFVKNFIKHKKGKVLERKTFEHKVHIASILGRNN